MKSLTGTISFQGDVLIFENTYSQCKKRLQAERDVINETKTSTITKQSSFLGYNIETKGRSPIIEMSIEDLTQFNPMSKKWNNSVD